MRKSFTGPFWVVVVLGGFYVLSMAVTLLFGKPDDAGVGYVLLSLLWTAVLVGEALLYWRIRKRNEARKESWAHVVTLAFTFLVPVFRGVMIEAFFGKVFGEQIGKEMLDYFSWEKTALYWTLMVLAHMFFGRVLWKVFVVMRSGGVAAVRDRGVARDGVASSRIGVGQDGVVAREGVSSPGKDGARPAVGSAEEKPRPPVVGITILPEPEQKDMLDDIWS